MFIGYCLVINTTIFVIPAETGIHAKSTNTVLFPRRRMIIAWKTHLLNLGVWIPFGIYPVEKRERDDNTDRNVSLVLNTSH